MAWFSQMAPRLYVGCPRCGSSTAVVSHERYDSQTCFCPLCRHLWQTALSRPAAGRTAEHAATSETIA